MILKMIFFLFDSSWIARGLKIMVNALGERSFCSSLKCYQFSLALQSGHNHTYYSYNYKIAFTVFFQGKSKIEFWREDEDFLRLLFKGPQQLRLPFWFLLQKKKKCRKLLNQKKKVFRQWVEIQFLQFGPTKCQHQRFIMLEKSKENLTLNFKD